jgi:hypothetical protein
MISRNACFRFDVKEFFMTAGLEADALARM